MKRAILDYLKIWKGKNDRKPLILKGTRQVGKTYILQQFGREMFNAFHYFNFEKNPALGSYFRENLDPEAIVQNLSIEIKSKIKIGSDLVIFDEIQSAPHVLTSLKYFSENMPNLHIAAAGSLLGLCLGDHSYPVGKVDELEMHPMSFEEFLIALGETDLQEILGNPQKLSLIPDPLHKNFLQLLRQYLITGGLPEVINDFISHRNDLFTAFQAVRLRQNTIINQYLADISKHCGKINSMHISRIFQNIPAQLSSAIDSSVGRFKFKGVVEKVSKYDRLASALDWLVAANLAIKVPIANSGELPSLAFTKENIFKLFVFDVGILGALGDFDPQSIMNYDFGTQKGFLMENFVLQHLRINTTKEICAWSEGVAEIEFLVPFGGRAMPIEVKAGRSRRSKSLEQFRKKYNPPISVIVSETNFAKKGPIVNIPHYAVGELFKLVL